MANTKTIQQKIDETWDKLKTPVVDYNNFSRLPADNVSVAQVLTSLLMAQTNIDDLRLAEFDWDYSKQHANTAGTGNMGWEQSHPTVSHARATLANLFATYVLKPVESGSNYLYLARADYYILKGLLEDIEDTRYEMWQETLVAVLEELRSRLCAKDPKMLVETIKESGQ